MTFKEAEEKLKALISVPVISHDEEIMGQRIHYVTAGSAGEPVVFVHGVNIGWGEWYPNIAALAEHHVVYAIDLPGCGGSSPLDFFTADIAQTFTDVVGAFIAQHDFRNVTLVGHSVGGFIVLKVAALGSVDIRAVVLEDPLGFGDFMPIRFRPLYFAPIARFLAKVAVKGDPSGMREFFKSVMRADVRLPDAFLEYFSESLIFQGDSHPFFMIHRLFGSLSRIGPSFLLGDAASRIEVPTLIVFGANDPLIPWATVEGEVMAMPRVQVVHMQGVGHVPSIENSVQFNERVIGFLDSLS